METVSTNWKPYGAQAGFITGQQELDANQMNALSMEKSALENLVKQRDASFAQDEMNNPLLREMRMKGMIGKDQSSVAQGQFDTETLQGRIKSQLSEYAAKVPKAQLEQEMAESSILLRKLQQLEGFGTQTGFDGLEFTTGAMRAAQEMGAPPQVIQAFQQANPKQRAEMIKGIRENLEHSLTIIPSVLQEQAKETHKGKIQEGIHAGDRASRERVANIHESGANSRAEVSRDAQMKLATIEQQMVLELNKANNPNLSQTERAQAQVNYKTLEETKTRIASAAAREKAAADAEYIANLRGGGVPRQQPSPSPAGNQGGRWEVRDGKKVWVTGAN